MTDKINKLEISNIQIGHTFFISTLTTIFAFILVTQVARVLTPDVTVDGMTISTEIRATSKWYIMLSYMPSILLGVYFVQQKAYLLGKVIAVGMLFASTLIFIYSLIF